MIRRAPIGMTEEKPPERKRWNPDCPKCREELQRHSDLWQAQYDDVDHGAGIYRLLFEHYCTHENGEEGRSAQCGASGRRTEE